MKFILHVLIKAVAFKGRLVTFVFFSSFRLRFHTVNAGHCMGGECFCCISVFHYSVIIDGVHCLSNVSGVHCCSDCSLW